MMNWLRILGAIAFALAARPAAAQYGARFDPFTGVMEISTGISDIVAVFIEGPNVSNMGCSLCDGMHLPGAQTSLADASTWTVGYSAGATQWIRTNPLAGRGFVGTIADFFVDGSGLPQPWPQDIPPFLNFPEQGTGIAVYPPGLGPADFGTLTFVSSDLTMTTCGLTLAGGCTTQIPGDFNGDGLYDCADIDSLVAVIANGSHVTSFDLTGDGQVDVTDLDTWLAIAGSANLASGNAYLRGDADLDGTVDGSDFLAWNSNKFTSAAAWCSGDFNADGVVDGSDFLQWNTNKFSSADQLAAIPEPTPIGFLSTAAICLMGIRKRR